MRITRLAALAAAALVATTMATAADAAPAHHAATKRIVVRPVNSNGHVVAGFTRHDFPDKDPVFCSFDHGHGSVSTVAVDPHIFGCSPSAAYAIACWDTTLAHHVLCYQSAFSHRVVRFHGTAPVHVAKPSHPYNALNLVLANGEQCSARDGGAVGIQKYHPNWIATYYCGTGGDTVWSPNRLGRTQGTDRSESRWTAYVGTANGHLHKRAISKAYFVGTAS
jgi:hypothetical protein